MTDDEINIALNKWMGWSDIDKRPSGLIVGLRPTGNRWDSIPRYTTSLDAMHEAEADG